jgi:hypothetical protein
MSFDENDENDDYDYDLSPLGPLKRPSYIHDGPCIAKNCKCDIESGCICQDKEKKCQKCYRYWCHVCYHGAGCYMASCINPKCSLFREYLWCSLHKNNHKDERLG